jgi:uncharacterized SAM-binding protein YcdF (DUF218 family)
MYKEFKMGSSNSPFGFLGPLLILTVIFIGLYFLLAGLFKLLLYISPILLIATLVMDHTVVTGFLKYVWNLVKEKPLMGLVTILLTFLGFPFVTGFLFFKAYGKRTLKKIIDKANPKEEGFVEYEEVVDSDDAFLELPQLSKQQKSAQTNTTRSNDYDDMFK